MAIYEKLRLYIVMVSYLWKTLKRYLWRVTYILSWKVNAIYEKLFKFLVESYLFFL